jgi:F0F1-type ATP synthase membrane subunit c/vacuolar-type H+-ATPase subunit K
VTKHNFSKTPLIAARTPPELSVIARVSQVAFRVLAESSNSGSSSNSPGDGSSSNSGGTAAAPPCGSTTTTSTSAPWILLLARIAAVAAAIAEGAVDGWSGPDGAEGWLEDPAKQHMLQTLLALIQPTLPLVASMLPLAGVAAEQLCTALEQQAVLNQGLGPLLQAYAANQRDAQLEFTELQPLLQALVEGKQLQQLQDQLSQSQQQLLQDWAAAGQMPEVLLDHTSGGRKLLCALQAMRAVQQAVPLQKAVAAGQLQQLRSFAYRMAALLPMPYVCNNPDCWNMESGSELQPVGGKSCVCKACKSARWVYIKLSFAESWAQQTSMKIMCTCPILVLVSSQYRCCALATCCQHNNSLRYMKSVRC